MRRDFLKLCALTGIGFACPGGMTSLLRAAVKEEPPYEGPFYIVFNASGGWDTTYLMDPKGINEINRLYKEGDIITKGAHKFAPTGKTRDGGMSNEEFYDEFGRELEIVVEDATATPEPGTLALLCAGLAGVAGSLGRRKNAEKRVI